MAIIFYGKSKFKGFPFPQLFLVIKLLIGTGPWEINLVTNDFVFIDSGYIKVELSLNINFFFNSNN